MKPYVGIPSGHFSLREDLDSKEERLMRMYERKLEASQLKRSGSRTEDQYSREHTVVL